MTTPDPQPTYTPAAVEQALNKAADDVLEAACAGDEGLRDAVNLVVNATMCYLSGDAANLEMVAAQNYSEDLDTILGWIGS